MKKYIFIFVMILVSVELFGQPDTLNDCEEEPLLVLYSEPVLPAVERNKMKLPPHMSEYSGSIIYTMVIIDSDSVTMRLVSITAIKLNQYNDTLIFEPVEKDTISASFYKDIEKYVETIPLRVRHKNTNKFMRRYHYSVGIILE